MTEGEKMVWAAAYALALGEDLGADAALWLAASTVVTLRNATGADHVEASDQETEDMRAEMLS